MQIFISHASQNAAEASAVCRLLEERGTRCFIAPRDIRTGKEYAEEIVNGLDGSAAVLLLMSEAANRSPHVLREVERAVSKSIPILVYKLEEVALSKSMEYFLMTHQWSARRTRTGMRVFCPLRLICRSRLTRSIRQSRALKRSSIGKRRAQNTKMNGGQKAQIENGLKTKSPGKKSVC